MDFSKLVMIRRDENNNYVGEACSFIAFQGAEYVTKLYTDGKVVHMIFDTAKDVEDWEFEALFDYFNEESFDKYGVKIEPIDEEFNPTWGLEFDYIEDEEELSLKVERLCRNIALEIENAFNEIKDKQDEYIVEEE